MWSPARWCVPAITPTSRPTPERGWCRFARHRLCRSEQFSELLDGESGVADNAAHREGIHRVVARNGKNALAIRHDDVSTLPQNAESNLLQSTNSLKVGNSGNFAH